MKKKSISINSVFNLDASVDLNIAYEYTYEEGTEYTINVSPRRNIKLHASSKSDIFLVLFDYNRSLYAIKKLEFDSKGVAKLPLLLDKYEIARTPVDSATWAKYKKYPGKSHDIFLYDKGYYTLRQTWMDCNVWHTSVYFKDGIPLNDGILKKFSYSQIAQKMESEYYSLLEKMLTADFSSEDYSKFKAEYIQISFENRFLEILL